MFPLLCPAELVAISLLVYTCHSCGNNFVDMEVTKNSCGQWQGGLERSSMQPVFHVQFYSVCDEQVIWNAEFEDMILINQKNQRVVDHSKLSSWRSL